MDKSFLGQSQLPRGLRNNNIGNLVMTSINWQGKIPNSQNTDGHFEQFENVIFGIRAMMKDLYNDYNKGKNTVSALISEYAPSFENNTDNYISIVSSYIGVAPNEPIKELTKQTLIGLSKVIARVENGQIVEQYINESDYLEAYEISGISLVETVKKKSPL